MSTSPAMLDRPPMQPPSVTSQMGAAGIDPGATLGRSVGMDPAAAQAGPKSQIMAMGDAVKRLLGQMAKMDDSFGPYASRATDMVQAGLQASQSAPPGGAGAQPSPQAHPSPATSGFPG